MKTCLVCGLPITRITSNNQIRHPGCDREHRRIKSQARYRSRHPNAGNYQQRPDVEPTTIRILYARGTVWDRVTKTWFNQHHNSLQCGDLVDINGNIRKAEAI